jgi:hypothetical protein
MEELVSLEGVLCHILGDAGIDAGALPLDTPLSDLGEFRGVQGWIRWAGEAAGTAEPTIADLGRTFERSSRIVGSSAEVADKLDEWRDAGIDGVNVFHAVRPDTFKDIAELLFPELRRRGLLSDDKSGTLRHKLSGGGSRSTSLDAPRGEVPRGVHRQLTGRPDLRAADAARQGLTQPRAVPSC